MVFVLIVHSFLFDFFLIKNPISGCLFAFLLCFEQFSKKDQQREVKANDSVYC